MYGHQTLDMVNELSSVYKLLAPSVRTSANVPPSPQPPRIGVKVLSLTLECKQSQQAHGKMNFLKLNLIFFQTIWEKNLKEICERFWRFCPTKLTLKRKGKNSRKY